jgi:hypothetical protein
MPGTEIRNVELHTAFTTAWKEGSVDGMLDVVSDDCFSIARSIELEGDRRTRTAARGKDEHRSAFAPETYGRVLDFQVISFLAGPWYVFAEYDLELELPHGRQKRSMAAVYPVGREGKLIGQLAYAIDHFGATASRSSVVSGVTGEQG